MNVMSCDKLTAGAVVNAADPAVCLASQVPCLVGGVTPDCQQVSTAFSPGAVRYGHVGTPNHCTQAVNFTIRPASKLGFSR
jgi:hypothetical protein